jgi:tetratricopeptide (TPR) repeat protein
MREVPGTTGYNRRQLAFGALILLAVLVLYLPALGGQFVWDDPLLVQKNPLVTGKLNLLSVWFSTDFPLTLSVFWLQWLVWGTNPVGFHVVNVLLHALNAILVWRVLLRLKISGAWLGAAIFALHPVCAASAAWISEQKNTLAMAFYLLSLLCYLRSEQERAKSESKLFGAIAHTFYWLSLFSFLLALLSKTSTVMLPVVLIGCVWWKEERLTRRDLLRTSPFFLLALIFGLLTIWFQKHQAMAGLPVQSENLWGRLAGAAIAVWFYIGKALLPFKLNMIYPRWGIDPSDWHSWLPLVMLAFLLALFWRFRRTWGRPMLFVLGYFIVTLFPVLGFFDMYYLTLSRVSDHFQYVPLIGIAALGGSGLNHLLKLCRNEELVVPSNERQDVQTDNSLTRLIPTRKMPVVAYGIAILLLALSVLTFQRARVLASNELLWRDTVTKNPAAWLAHNNLGCILSENKKYEEAIEHFRTSIKFNERNPYAHANLARALALEGKTNEAEEHIRIALKIKPDDAAVQKSFAAMLSSQGKQKQALAHLREAIRLEPDVETRLQFADLLHNTGDAKEAITQYRKALESNPDLIEALNNLAWLLATSYDPFLRNGPEAVRLAERACELTHNQQAVHLGTLAAALAEAGRFAEAVNVAEKSAQIATAAGQPQIAAMNQQLLIYYRAGKAWHEPALKLDSAQ